MDSSTPTPQQTPPPTPSSSAFMSPPPSTSEKNMNSFASFGKIALIIVFGLFLGLGGYFLGKVNNKSYDASPTPTITIIQAPSEVPNPTSTPSGNTKLIKAGLSTPHHSFQPYTIQAPTDWTDAHETTVAAGIDKLTLTKQGYSLTIYQAAIGGGGCVYKGEKLSEMATTFNDYVAITAGSLQFRRSWNPPAQGVQVTNYTICQKTSEGNYSNITTFGVINAVSPNSANTAILAEIDGMISSLTKQ